MKERKSIKLNVNMYEDTKFKIIDRMEQRDLINYVWTRLLVLAARVNLCGELFLSRNIPYTLETLAIEFNREVYQVELAIKTFMDLEMVEVTEDKVYKVKNFAKHQNIKVEVKDKWEDKASELNNGEENKVISEIHNEEGKSSCYKDIANGNKKVIKLNNINSNIDSNSNNIEKRPINNANLSIDNSNTNSGVILDTEEISVSSDAVSSSSIVNDSNLKKKTNEENSKADISKNIENRTKNRKADEKKTRDDTNEINTEEVEEDIVEFYEGEFKLGEGEKLVRSFNF